MPALKPFFSYFGSKFNIAGLYPEPRHNRIVELFAGSAAYSCCYPEKRITLIDTNPDITITWIYLIRSSETEILSLPNIRLGQDIRDIDVCPEARILIGWWCGKGRTTPAKSVQDNQWTRKYKINSRCSYWGEAIRQRIAQQQQYIRHWKVICDDWDNYVESSRREATWFIDPPYQNAGIHYPYNGIDYRLLSSACYQLRGQVIVCENEGADWMPFRHLRQIKANNSVPGEVRYRDEVVWTKTA